MAIIIELWGTHVFCWGFSGIFINEKFLLTFAKLKETVCKELSSFW
jgi:hypothetical protein